MLYISFLFFALASVCNAIMETSNDHYSVSKLAKFNAKWWDGGISWGNKYIDGLPSKGRVKWFWKITKPVQLTDAFHFFKMLMVIFICFAVVSFRTCSTFIGCSMHWYVYLILVGVYGFIWDNTFSLFFNRLLK